MATGRSKYFDYYRDCEPWEHKVFKASYPLWQVHCIMSVSEHQYRCDEAAWMWLMGG